MTRSTLQRGGLTLAFEESGAGAPVIFQHGLGADAAQIAEIFPDELKCRRITLECRAQGQSDAGPPGDLSIATFADDVTFLAERLGIHRAVFGGISMGAAIALRIAVRRPDLVGALVLARPAWLFEPAPKNMRAFAVASECMTGRESGAALAAFEATAVAQKLAREAPDNLVSLRGFFGRPAPTTTTALLGAIARDGPGVSEAEARRLAVPTLVIGNREDVVHPLAYAETMAATIPGARFVEIPSKTASRAGYVAGFRAALAAFLSEAGSPASMGGSAA